MKTTKEIYNAIIASIEAQTGEGVPLPKRAFTRVVATAFAGIFTILFKYVDFILLQMFPQFASTKETTVLGNTIIPLEELGIRNGAGKRKTDQDGLWSMSVTTLIVGQTISAGTLLTGDLSGKAYKVLEDTTTTTTSTSFQITSIDAGEAGALLPSEGVTFDTSSPNHADGATYVSEDTTPTTAESWDVYRARVLLEEQLKPQGGAYFDYYKWGIQVNGVSGIYPYTSATPGWVDVFAEADGVALPSAAQLAAVAAIVELNTNGLAENRPVGARVNVAAVTLTPAITYVYGLEAPDVTQTRANISTAVEAYYDGLEPYIEGVSQPPRVDTWERDDLSSLIRRVAAEDGATITSVTVSFTTGTSRVLEHGERLKYSSVEWL